MVEKLKFQPVIVELCGLSHLILVVGDAWDKGEEAVDNPADSRWAADAKNPLKSGWLS